MLDDVPDSFWWSPCDVQGMPPTWLHVGCIMLSCSTNVQSQVWPLGWCHLDGHADTLMVEQTLHHLNCHHILPVRVVAMACSDTMLPKLI